MSYTTEDFTESLKGVRVAPNDVEVVIAAWGKGDGMGEGAAGYRWSEESVTEWSGGFLLKLRDGAFAYVTGWCDYTGWGCQDGASVYRFDHEPSVEEMVTASENSGNPPPAADWDREPADLNKWLADGAKDPDVVAIDD